MQILKIQGIKCNVKRSYKIPFVWTKIKGKNERVGERNRVKREKEREKERQQERDKEKEQEQIRPIEAKIFEIKSCK